MCAAKTCGECRNEVMCCYASRCRNGQKAKLLVGAMDGSVSILDAEEGHVLCTTKAHTKYCVQATWNSSGTGFITASWDQSLCMYEWSSGEEI